MRKIILMAIATYVLKRYFSRDTPQSSGDGDDTDTSTGKGNGSRKTRRSTTGKPREATRRRTAAAAQH